MRQAVAVFSAGTAVLGLLAGCAAPRPPSAADYRLVAPVVAGQRAYLGLAPEATSFNLEDIRCELLVVDCFDLYCHLCQTGAKHVNELYTLAGEQGLASRVKFIGLGVGDTPLEVATYQEKFKLPFPVFPDRRAILAKRFGELRLPNLIVLRSRAGRLEVIHRSPGTLQNPAEFLSQIRAALAQATPERWANPLQAAQPTCGEKSLDCRHAPASSRGAGLGAAGALPH